MNPEALPKGLQNLILLNAALDIPSPLIKRGGIFAAFGIILFFGILVGVILFNIVAFIIHIVTFTFSLFSPRENKPPNDTAIQQHTTIDVNMSQTENQTHKYIGSIKWTYFTSKSPDTFPVMRAIRSNNSITIDCNCGSQHQPYIYTIKMESSDGIIFSGTFTAGDPPNNTYGTVNCNLQKVSNGILLQGRWIEGGVESIWFSGLKEVANFPDE